MLLDPTAPGITCFECDFIDDPKSCNVTDQCPPNEVRLMKMMTKEYVNKIYQQTSLILVLKNFKKSSRKCLLQKESGLK